MTSNLPPGVTDSMIPGNRPEDVAWENFHAYVDSTSSAWGLEPSHAYTIWSLGVQEFKAREAMRRQGHDEGMTEAADILDEMNGMEHTKDVAALIRPSGSLRLRSTGKLIGDKG